MGFLKQPALRQRVAMWHSLATPYIFFYFHSVHAGHPRARHTCVARRIADDGNDCIQIELCAIRRRLAIARGGDRF